MHFKVRKRLYLLSCILLLFFTVGNLYSSGQKEDKLKIAKDFYNKKMYNQALLLIKEVIIEEPQRFDEAVKLSNKINKKYKEYNIKLKELNKSIFELQDPEKAAKIFKEMEEIIPNPNVEMAGIFETIKENTIIIANLKYFNRVMDKAFEYLKEEKYTYAVMDYFDGLLNQTSVDLHRAEFDAIKWGNVVENEIYESLSRITVSVETYLKIEEDIQNNAQKILENLPNAIKGDISLSLNPLFEGFTSIVDVINTIKTASEVLKNIYGKLRQKPEGRIAVLYLKYMYQFGFGRDSREQDEGLVYSISTMMRKIGLNLENKYKEKSLFYSSQAESEYLMNQYESARINFKNAISLNTYILPLVYFNDSNEILSNNFNITLSGGWIVEDSLFSFMDIQEELKKIYTYLYIMDLKEKYTSYMIPEEPVSKKNLENLWLKAKENMSGVKLLAENWMSYRRQREERVPLNFDVSNTSRMINLCIRMISSFLKEHVEMLFKFYNSVENNLKQEKELLENGIEHEQYGIVFYPDQRVNMLSNIDTNLTYMDENIKKITGIWLDENDYINEQNMIKVIRNVEDLSQNVTTLTEEVFELKRIAENKILQAKKNKDLGNLRFDEANRAYAKDNFSLSISKLSEASEAYYKSLEYSEDSEVRSKYTEVESYYAMIEERENVLVYEEVRSYIKKGADLYAKGLYIEALEMFLSAQDRYKDTQSEPHPEIKDWLGYVQSALTIESGRLITEGDPLYKEITSLYNLAKEDYNKGIESLKENETDKANEFFSKSEEKLIMITKQFPYNRDARLLKLYILKEKDNEGFKQIFSDRMQEAKAYLNKSRELKQEAYNDLKDLAEIDPKYPGLNKLIVDFEYALGIRRREADPAKKRESASLTKQARPYIENRQIDYFSLAKNLLTRALELNPDNDEAKNLFDKMGIIAGSEKKYVISAVAMKMYEDATRLYINGQYIESYNIVQNLLKNQQNRGYPPLKELEERLKVVLGIS